MDPIYDNDYDEEEYEEEYGEEEYGEDYEEVEVMEEPEPLEEIVVYILGNTSRRSKNNKIMTKRPIIFKATKTGWVSSSLEKGHTNVYVSNETWNQIENGWLPCNLSGIEIFWEEEEFMERINTLVEKYPEYKEGSSYFKYQGLDIYDEVRLVKKRLNIY